MMEEQMHEPSLERRKDRKCPLSLLERPNVMTTVSGPMVRYSKLPFRALVRKYGVDIVYTPMILADPFRQSQKARMAEFSSNDHDTPLVIQFAAKTAEELADAASLVIPYVDAVDINCGCPQRWALQEGIGAALLRKDPTLLQDMIRQTRARTNLPVSVKIRLLDDHRATVDLVRQVEAAGASWLTLHGRTVSEKTSVPVHVDSIRLVKENASIPIIANGDIFSYADAVSLYNATGVNGVMAARGLLCNPALFAKESITPLECVQEFVSLSLAYGLKTHLFHQHLIEMLSAHMSSSEKKLFHCLSSTSTILDFLERKLSLPITLFEDHDRNIS